MLKVYLLVEEVTESSQTVSYTQGPGRGGH